MLLEFKAANYKSFKEEFSFSLVPAPKQKGLDYSVMTQRAGKKIYKGLSSAIIYGPNASGKSNLIGAMDTFKSIVLRGNIRNDADVNDPNIAAGMLDLIPNITDIEIKPLGFSITFIEDGLIIEYAFSADIGTFLAGEYKRKILSETLKINKNLIFERNGELAFGSFNAIQDFLVNNFEQHTEGAISIAKSNLDDEELFLMNGFKSIFSSKLAAMISNWLEKRFMVIYRADSMRLIRNFNDPRKKSIIIDKTISDAANHFGIDSNALGYVFENENDEAKLYSFIGSADVEKAIPAELFESYGTIRFINLFPLVANALLYGGTLIVDEFDASIHPMVLMSIINIFHNDDINAKHAQLIFNTHNPIFLNANLFRRDEIKFVERDEETHLSALYSLSDFGTTGKKGVRNSDDYMKNYFVDRYGAIKNIDFTPIFETMLSGEKEV